MSKEQSTIDYEKKHRYGRNRKYAACWSPDYILGKDHPSKINHTKVQETLPQFIDFTMNTKVYKPKVIKHSRTRRVICISNPGKRP